MKYIDLGLSVLWADCNIGANTPEEFSNYYNWNNIPKKYEIPTIEQYKELIENCNCTWTNQNGINGYKVTSKKNDNSIFLPAAGHRYYNTAYGKDNYGFYWASSRNMDYKNIAYYLYFSSVQVDYCINYYHMGFSVRAIKSKTNFKNKTTMMTLKEVNEIFTLKSGMCLKLTKGKDIYREILFQYGNEYMCRIDYDGRQSWTRLDYSILDKYDRIEIFKSPSKINIFEECDKIFDSNDYKIVELTLQEIADKFGVNVKNLKIKK